MEFGLLGAALVAAVAGRLGLRLAERPRLVRPGDADLLLGATLVGLAAGRLAAMITSGTNPLTHLGDVILVRGGVHTGWASLAALLYAARPPMRGGAPPAGRFTSGLATLDRLAVPGLFALGGWHLGCIVRGTCLGAAADWSWLPAQAGIARHPVEIYTAALLLVGAAVLLRTHHRLTATGRTAGAALIVAAGARLVTEPLRLSIGGGPVGWYVAGLVVGVLLLARPVAARELPTPNETR